ncbi:MAG: hypothetical protein KDA51_09715, partial [Planctomycetales bacterium]|nr:hypothetical protein [Planctomycetales bacterium]
SSPSSATFAPTRMLSQPVATCEIAFSGNPNCLVHQVCHFYFYSMRALVALSCSTFCVPFSGLFFDFGPLDVKSCRFR